MQEERDGIDIGALADLAVSAAEGAGALLLGGVHERRATVETKSSGTDMVTEMDLAAEQAVVEAIRAERPDDAILGEEGAAEAGTTGVRWIIDPLDGTTNYLYRLPVWAVSVAAEVDGEIVAGAVHDPVHQETFRTVRGGGATLNGGELNRASGWSREPPELATALVATGFSYDPATRREQAVALAGIIHRVRDVRRAGAAALDLCWVAAGRLDLYYESGLQPWDWAAAALVATEAGIIVGGLDGGPPSRQLVIAAPPHLDAPFRALLGSNLRQ